MYGVGGGGCMGLGEGGVWGWGWGGWTRNVRIRAPWAKQSKV